MHQSTMWSRQTKKHTKGNHRRKNCLAKQILGVTGNTCGTPSILKRSYETHSFKTRESRANSTTFVYIQRKEETKMKKLMTLVLTVAMLAGCSSTPTTEEGNTLTVGMECNYAPFNWTDVTANDDNVSIGSVGYCDGYDVQIAKHVADAMGRELVISKMDWDALEPSLSSGNIDAIIAGMTDTEERRQNADFTTPYYQSEMVMIVRKDSNFVNAKTLAEFDGAKIQGQMNTMYDTVIDQIPNVQHQTPLENYPYLIASLNSGAVDGITAETPVGLGAVAAHPDLALVVFNEGEGFQIDISDTAVSIAVKKGNSELLDAIQKALDGINEDTRAQLMEEATSRQPANV